MEDRRRRAYIKQQVTARKKEGTGTSNLSTKRKLVDKTNRLPKKPKVMVGPIEVTRTETKLPPPIEVTRTETKLPPPPVYGKGKGLMMGQVPADEKRLILLCEDP